MSEGKASVQLTPIGNPVTGWYMSLDGGSKKGTGKYPEILVAKGDTKKVTYSIVQPSPPAPAIAWAKNAFCAVAGTTKPKPTQYCDNSVFTWTINNDGNLVVTDHNNHNGQMDYYYVINFDNNVPSLDPIYNNGGTSKNGFGLTPSMEFGAIVLAVAIVVLVIWQIMKARAVPKADEDSISR